MFNDESKRSRAMGLFRKAWQAFPEERMNLISYVSRDDFWQLPETYEYAREGLIPDKTVYSPNGEWYAFEQILSWSSDGRVHTMVSRVLDLAVSQNRLEELAGQIEAARKKFPDWKAGKALAALVDCRLGKYDEARKLVREVLDMAKEQAFSSNVPWVIGAELENHGATRELAVSVYESCLTGRTQDPYSFLQFDNSPIKRLVTMYTREGRKDDARRVMLEFVKPRDFSGGYPEDYIAQLRVSGQSSVGAAAHGAGLSPPTPCRSSTRPRPRPRRSRPTGRTMSAIATG